jgi:uncharacterized membrane protein YqjE
MGDQATDRPGLLRNLRRLATTALAILQNRLELLLVEFKEERLRLFNALLLAAAVAALGCLTLTTAMVTLLVVVWVKYRLAGLAAMSCLFLVATLLAYWRLRVHLKNWTPFSVTLAELKKDRECLESKK